MKLKIFMATVFTLAMFALTGCMGGAKAESPQQENEPNIPVTPKSELTESFNTPGRAIIVCYSYSDKTRRVAKRLEHITGADYYEVRTIKAYPGNPHTTALISMEERLMNDLPEIATDFPDLSQYDVIYIGGPVWNARIATPLAKFLSLNPLCGKTIIPFWTFHGSGEDGYLEDFGERMKDAGQVLKGFGIVHPEDMSDAEIDDTIVNWQRDTF